VREFITHNRNVRACRSVSTEKCFEEDQRIPLPDRSRYVAKRLAIALSGRNTAFSESEPNSMATGFQLSDYPTSRPVEFGTSGAT
jgi:hypothetical protein